MGNFYYSPILWQGVVFEIEVSLWDEAMDNNLDIPYKHFHFEIFLGLYSFLFFLKYDLVIFLVFLSLTAGY
ncbi:hypothetical protein GCM10007966_19190 [Legionella impletisoli]|uniref:Uncharacterized protein n=1 Tax=Legionella impletisoli TaxID=343510 RepID=A0A917NCZ0_9GAMM|nr:hypothetical protein GCM10007966_19190 [Legionella impletisoli]